VAGITTTAESPPPIGSAAWNRELVDRELELWPAALRECLARRR
jgi:hypothetical protein